MATGQSAQCAECGWQLALDHAGPCPNCGAARKRYNVSIHAAAKGRASLGWQHVREYYEKHPVIVPAVIAITAGAPFLGLVLAGWGGVIVGLIIGTATLLLGLRALTGVREIKHSSEP